MRRARLASLLLSVVVLATSVLVGGAPAQAAVTYSVSGTVYLGSTATPASAGEVLVRWSTTPENIPAAGVLTDAAGAFTLPALTDGASYYLYYEYRGAGAYPSVYHPGVVTSSGAAVIAIAGADVTGVAGIIPAPGALTGRLTQLANGQAFHNGEITVYKQVSGAWVATGSLAYPDNDGYYSIPNLPAGVYKIGVRNLGYTPVQDGFYGGSSFLATAATSPFGGAGDTAPRNIALTPTQAINGRVTLGAGGAYAGAYDVRVSLWYVNPDTGQTVSGANDTVTSSGGYFSFYNLDQSADYTLEFHYTKSTLLGYLPSYVQNVSTGTSETTTRNVTLAQANTIAGTVRLGAGGPLAASGEVTVTLQRPASPAVTTTTSAGGVFVANTLEPGTYSLSFHYNGAGDYPDISLAAPITVPADVTDLAVTMAQGTTITGRATSASNPGFGWSGVTVVAHRLDPDTGEEVGQYTATTDSVGRYTFKNVRDGEYWVEFISAGGAYQAWEGAGRYDEPTLFEVIPGTVNDNINAVMYAAGEIYGDIYAPTITDFTPGAFAAEILVYDGSAWIATGDITVVNETRHFHIGGFGPGDYRLHFTYNGPLGFAETTTPTITVTAGQAVRYDPAMGVPVPPLAVGTLVKIAESPQVYLVDGADRLVPIDSMLPVIDAGVSTTVQTVPVSRLGSYSIAAESFGNVIRCGGSSYNMFLATGGRLVQLSSSFAGTWPGVSLSSETCQTLQLVISPAIEDVLYIASGTGQVFRVGSDRVTRPVINLTNTGALVLFRYPVYDVNWLFRANLPQGGGSAVPGSLIKGSTSPTVYMSDGDSLIPVPNMSTITDFGLSTAVTVLPQSFIAAYEIDPHPLVNVVNCGGSYYVGAGGMRQSVASSLVSSLDSSSLNIDTCNAMRFFRPAPSYYLPPHVSTALFLKSPSSPTIYYIDSSGQKRAVVAMSSLAVLSAPDAPRYLTVNDAYLASIPTGPKLLPVGAMVRGPSTRVYFVAGFNHLVPILSYDTTASMGLPSTFTPVTQVDINQATVDPDTSPLTNTVVCSGQTYFAASGKLWPVNPALVAALPQTQLDASACSVLPKSAFAIAGAFLVQSAPGGTVFQVLADGSKRALVGRAALRLPSTAVLTVASSFLNSLPTGPPVAPLQIGRPPAAYLAPLPVASAVTESVTPITIEERAACYSGYLSTVPVSVFAAATPFSDAEALLAECLAG